MSKLRFCGNCGLDFDFQQLPRKLAQRYRRDPAHCPRCHAPADADAYTLRRQDTAERLAVGPLVAPEAKPPAPPAAPRRHLGTFISTIAASLSAVIIVLATLMILDVIKLQDIPPAAMHSVAAATSTPTATPTSTASVVSGPPIVMTIQPYAITADCNSATSAATTTLSNFGTTAFQWAATITPQSADATPFQLTPLSGVLQPQATQTLTISQITHAGTIVIMANGVGESIIVTCAATPANTVTPVGT